MQRIRQTHQVPVAQRARHSLPVNGAFLPTAVEHRGKHRPPPPPASHTRSAQQPSDSSTRSQGTQPANEAAEALNLQQDIAALLHSLRPLSSRHEQHKDSAPAAYFTTSPAIIQPGSPALNPTARRRLFKPVPPTSQQVATANPVQTLKGSCVLADEYYNSDGSLVSFGGLDEGVVVKGLNRMTAQPAAGDSRPAALLRHYLEAACPLFSPVKPRFRTREPTPPTPATAASTAAGPDSVLSTGQVAVAMKLLRRWPAGQREVAVFKGGGIKQADIEHLVASCGWARSVRLTNVIREADCMVAVERWPNGRTVNLAQHRAGALQRGLPFQVLPQLDATSMATALVPVLAARRLLQQHPDSPQEVTLLREEALRQWQQEQEQKQPEEQQQQDQHRHQDAPAAGALRAVGAGHQSPAAVAHGGATSGRSDGGATSGRSDEVVSAKAWKGAGGSAVECGGAAGQGRHSALEGSGASSGSNSGGQLPQWKLQELKLQVAQRKLPLSRYAPMVARRGQLRH